VRWMNGTRGGGASYTLEFWFHDRGFSLTVLLSLLMRQGPCSWKRPIMEELPGFEILRTPRPGLDKQGDSLRHSTRLSAARCLGYCGPQRTKTTCAVWKSGPRNLKLYRPQGWFLSYDEHIG
jgi:hypothetical protein